MTGDSVDAATADRIGLVNYVVPADDLLEAATAFARRLAEGPGLAIRWTKMSINRIIWQNLNLVLEMGLATEAMSVWTKDHKEAWRLFGRIANRGSGMNEGRRGIPRAAERGRLRPYRS